MAPSSESEEYQPQDGLRHTMVGRGQICFTSNSHTESLSLGDNMPNRHQEQFKQAGAMRTGLVVGDGYAAADTRANASRVYNVARLLGVLPMSSDQKRWTMEESRKCGHVCSVCRVEQMAIGGYMRQTASQRCCRSRSHAILSNRRTHI